MVKKKTIYLKEIMRSYVLLENMNGDALYIKRLLTSYFRYFYYIDVNALFLILKYFK